MWIEKRRRKNSQKKWNVTKKIMYMRILQRLKSTATSTTTSTTTITKYIQIQKKEEIIIQINYSILTIMVHTAAFFFFIIFFLVSNFSPLFWSPIFGMMLMSSSLSLIRWARWNFYVFIKKSSLSSFLVLGLFEAKKSQMIENKMCERQQWHSTPKK